MCSSVGLVPGSSRWGVCSCLYWKNPYGQQSALDDEMAWLDGLAIPFPMGC